MVSALNPSASRVLQKELYSKEAVTVKDDHMICVTQTSVQ